MLATDSVALGDIRVGDGGYLEAIARTARTGVQTYRGAEVGRPELSTVNVFRDEAEVFSKRSLESFALLPLTIDHPAQPVTSANWKKLAVGTTNNDVLRDGEHLKIGLKITDAAAVASVQGGKRELSVGYTTELVWEDGKAPDGTPYQARQTAIVANHIAIVDAGRAGPQCRIGDSWADFTTPTKREPVMTLKTVTVDGIPVEVTDQGATVIATLQQRLADGKTDREKLVSDHASAIAAKDKELGTKDAEITKLKGQVLDAGALDKLIIDRADVLSKAKAIADGADLNGKSIPEIRRAVVAKKLGDAAVKDRSDDYVEALFDGLAKDVKPTDPVRQVIAGGLETHDANSLQALRDKSMAARLDRYQTAYLGEPADKSAA